MRNIAPLLAAVLLFAVVGCIPSLQPVYTEQDVVFDAALLGVWRDPQSHDRSSWSFSKSEGKAYRLVVTDNDGKQGAFTAHLARIGGMMVLDLYPGKPELAANDFYKLHLIRAHTFLLVDKIEPSLRMRLMRADWLKKLLEEHPEAIDHQTVEAGLIVLTATTEQLQQFVAKHAETKGAFSDPTNLKRE
jgi:hypothetical protein